MAGRAGRGRDEQTVSIDGHRLTLSHLDKPLYPPSDEHPEGTTKGDVIGYYAAVAPHLIRHSSGRPATRKRWVHGVGTAEQPGEVFFQKNLAAGTPSWVHRREIVHKSGVNEYPLVDDVATLTWLAQIATLEVHVPQWRFGRGGPLPPDRLVLDLDPGEGVGLPECVEVARLARSLLRDMGLDPHPVTSGSKGVHLYAALDGRQTSDQVSAVAHELARALEADHPELVVSDMKKTLRTGKVLVDWSQNSAAKTTIAPYSLRGRLQPTVAAPRTWRELFAPNVAQLDYLEVLTRLKKRGDPLEPATVPLSAAEATDARGASRDRLTIYRAKRDASRTPEPVPASVAAPAAGALPSFVIQEHHARALHYDFRLERDGVLVSWALPKGVPTEAKANHLAVHVEDHPLEYGSFAGVIPPGEYGAGTVSIWDSGDYDTEKWRDDEVIVTLHGTSGELPRPVKFALIRTKRGGGSGASEHDDWLIHLMKPPDHRPMLATLGDARRILADEDFDRDDWAIESKWDGYRAIATVGDGGLRLTSRNGIDLTGDYPDLSSRRDLVHARTAVLDGELVAFDDEGRPDFGLLQHHAETGATVFYLVFDALELDGRSLVGETYDARREALGGIVRGSGNARIRVPAELHGSLRHTLDESRERGLEGVMLKRRDERYRPGARSSGWVKLKHRATQEVVIGGWRPGTGGRRGSIGSLLVGVPDGDDLRYVGRVGSGFSDQELARLAERFEALASRAVPFTAVPDADASDAHWLRPELVGEVEFAGWTRERRLRQASWRGLRADKSPDEVVFEG